MEVVSTTFLQSVPEGCGQPLHSQSLQKVPNERQQGGLVPQHNPSAEKGGKKEGREMEQDSARPAHSVRNERKDSITGDPVNTRRSDVRQSLMEDAEPRTHDDKKGSSEEKLVKSRKRPPHRRQESTALKPSLPPTSEQDANLAPDVTAKDSVSVSSFGQLEGKAKVRVKKTRLQTVGKTTRERSSAAPIPVRITPRVDGVRQMSESFSVPWTDSVRKLPVMKIKPNELRVSGPPEKRKKTGLGAGSDLDEKKIQGSMRVNGKKHDHRDKRPGIRFPAKDEEISDDDIFREVPEWYSHRTSKAKKGTVVRFKDDSSSKCSKRDSRKSSGNIKDGRHHWSKSSSASSMAGNVSRTGKDSLARDLSRSRALPQKDRQRKQRHREQRSAAILAKRDKLMKTYKMDCEIFAIVAKQLIAQDASLEKRVESAVRKSLRLIGERRLAELKETIAKWDTAGAVKKLN
ncbi:uncharacterized protein LOC127581066 [Pristis pectinata]|uniref:uncharacterized protein LOC127581066 n=1 Tax=Pristis pectinata TaxID=685728 RepID=UPI00223D846D|nr:uncharacterized protein LOC127581066 [Pristis pectinata]